VEFALLAPMLALIVFGVIDLGRAYSLHNRLVNAAREGAVYGQYFPSRFAQSCDTSGIFADIVDKAIHQDTSLNLPATAVTGFYTHAGSSQSYSGCSQSFSAGDEVTVKVQRQLTILTPLVSAIVGKTITLTGTDQVIVQK
jgi:Flp pilus assembly protein TadG